MKRFFLLLVLWLAATAQEPDYALTSPGQGDLTFWARPEKPRLLAEGEVALGDFARTIARRRSNAAVLRKARDRYFARSRSFRDYRTADALVARLTPEGLGWTQRPALPVVAMAGAAFQLPLIIESEMPVSGAPQVLVNGQLAWAATKLARYGAHGYLLKLTMPAHPATHAVAVDVRLAGATATTEIRFDVRPRAVLRVRLSEAARVYLTAADGFSYAPEGALERLAAEPAEPYFHAAAGAFKVTVPAGVTRIEATRGPEYEWTSRLVTLTAGANAEVVLSLERWSDVGRDGWHAGDSHVHANYAARTHQNITPEDVRLIAEAEDLHVLNLTAANSYDDFLHDEGYFTGAPHPLSAGRHLLYWNEEFRGSDLYGHLGLFGLRTLIRPLFTGLAGSSSAFDYPLNYHQAKRAQEQGGAVTYMHPGYLPGFEGLSAAGGQPKELPADVALGVIDAMDVLSNAYETASVPLYHRLLNCGFRLGVSAGTDVFLNVRDHYIPGGGRVYVQSGTPLQYQAWLSAYKAGRSFATNGPMLRFTVNGKAPGELLALPAGARVRVQASVESRVPVDRVEVLLNGHPVIRRDQAPARIDEWVTVNEPAWIALRATGPWDRRIVNDTAAFAHTTPVYIALGGRTLRKKADALYFVRWMEQLMTQVSTTGRFRDAEQREEALGVLRRAFEVYRELAASGTD